MFMIPAPKSMPVRRTARVPAPGPRRPVPEQATTSLVWIASLLGEIDAAKLERAAEAPEAPRAD